MRRSADPGTEMRPAAFLKRNGRLLARPRSLRVLARVARFGVVSRIRGSRFRREHEHLIVHAGHHKVMSTYFGNVLRFAAIAMNLRIQRCRQRHLRDDTDIWLQPNSRIDFAALGRSYRATHVVRDPRDVIVSGYHYHLWTREPWCAVERGADGCTYQERLRALPPREGLALEIEGASGRVLETMDGWDYDDPDVLELRYEDLMQAGRADYRRIFEHYGFAGRELELCVDLMEMFSFANLTRRSAGQVKERSHLRSGASGGWRSELDASHRQRIKNRFGPLIVKLGYESDDSW